MTPDQWTHLEIVGGILGTIGIPGAIAAVKLIRGQARIELKVDTMWIWFTNHGSDITGYKKEK